MAKRKKYPKLPNGYGSIKYLGKGRRNPYAVHPPVTEFALNGSPITPKALCYVDDWMVGFAVLTAYRAGTYSPGMEKTLAASREQADTSGSSLVQRILSDYNLTKSADEKLPEKKKTFSEVYNDFYSWKYEQDKSRVYSASSRISTKSAFQNCQALHGKTFSGLRHQDLQEVIDQCTLKNASKELIISLFHQIYKYAEIYDLCEKDYSAHVKINTADDDEHGVPFSDSDLHLLWAHKDDTVVEMILIMCYSGYRIKAYETIRVDIKNWYFQGGVKTAAGKNRIVPIHSAIRPLVKRRIARDGKLLAVSSGAFRISMYAALESAGIEKHTPHDCRHTFSALCEKYGVNENDRKRMLGHSFQGDLTNSVYGHRSLDDLRAEIEKIKACY